MKLKLPKEFANRPEVALHLRKIGWVERIIYYWSDQSVATTTNMQKWINKNTSNEGASLQFMKDNPHFLEWNDIKKAKQALKFVHDNIKYTSDKSVWKVSEKWQTPATTWQLKTGDCEDGACLLYSILLDIGFTDDRLRIVTGDVKGAGHCYVTWLSTEDALEYPLDWCYWYSTSNKLATPYVEREEYFFGLREWWSFNATTAYKGNKTGEHTMTTSPRLSFKGYRFSEALYRNKDTIKLIIGLLASINAITGFDWKSLATSIGVASIGLVVKLLTDAVEFYFKDVEL